MSALNNLMHAISDHGNIVASKALTFFGVTSVGGGMSQRGLGRAFMKGGKV